jgi:NADPH:quinone reductase-like Zn-dependent oxidoreductase
VSEGGRVLVVGAAGGVGSLAVGVAKRLGAEVVGVCSTPDVDRVAALGADEVIDRKKTDPLQGEARFDMVFDTPAVHSFGACAHLLRDGGAYVTTLPSAGVLVGKLRALFSSKRCEFIAVKSRRSDLERLGEWLADGLEVPIDSRHPVREVTAALGRMSARRREGRVVVDVADGW